jgi:hypothetical protein
VMLCLFFRRFPMKNMAAAPTYFPVILSIVEKLPALYPQVQST